jgi:hypothetical protein
VNALVAPTTGTPAVSSVERALATAVPAVRSIRPLEALIQGPVGDARLIVSGV